VTSAAAIAALTLTAVFLIMAGEAVLSAFNERALRAKGAIETAGDVLKPMMWAYPISFLAMGIEGAFVGPSPRNVLAAGLVLFGFSKALKMSTISALGLRWTYKILVLPNAPLVTHGPYRLMRHPAYAAVMGELISVALIVWAPVSGILAAAGYGALLLRKIAAEDRALGRQ
jgi:methyltransferase